MKTLATILLSLLCTISLFGQEEKKHEIGINLFSITNYNNTINYETSIDINPPSGFMYKRLYGQNTIRIGLDFYHSKYAESHSWLHYYEERKGKSNEGIARIGYERKFTSTKLQPYFAIDFSINYSSDKGYLVRDREAIVYMPSGTFSYDYQNIRYGMAPAIGLKYNFSERFSASAEVNLNVMLFNVSFDNNSSNTSHIGEGGDLIFNPLRLFSVNYGF